MTSLWTRRALTSGGAAFVGGRRGINPAHSGGPRRQLPLPRLPGPGAALRHRPHDAVRSRPPRERWSHRRVESRVPVPTSPPAENRRLLDRPPDRRREPRMDHAARRYHPNRTRRGSNRTHRALRLLTERSHDQQDEVYPNELHGRLATHHHAPAPPPEGGGTGT
ncbi:conserved hypothetical protein [Rhodococcus jostii RHA1]|uniref:Uncharacterized protein n=1 Tax=Rhodococcus jostii (strain RHA1) TaxID=101510 RepID=Q0SH02_RHOJR|nr:conserved hypothetical protein [Rhodococcus jostii RHA1]